MEFSYKPINPFQKDELSSKDRAMIDGMRNTAYVCGYRGGDIEFAVNKALKRMGRFDLLPSCEQPKSKKLYMKKYIRFGEIPEDEISKAHSGDGILWNEKGVSVYDSVIVNGVYFPVLPPNPSECSYADYFYFLFGNKRVFVVTGDELPGKGSSGEPLLKNVEILEEITHDYEYVKGVLTRKEKEKE